MSAKPLLFELGAIKGGVVYDRELKVAEIGFYVTHGDDIPEDADAGQGIVMALQAAYLLLRASGLSVSDIKRGLREVESINYATQRDGSKTPLTEEGDGVSTSS